MPLLAGAVTSEIKVSAPSDAGSGHQTGQGVSTKRSMMSAQGAFAQSTGLYVVQIADEALDTLANFLRGLVIVQENEVKRRRLSDDVFELGQE